MTHEEAAELLLDRSSRERLRAATFFTQHATEADIPVLRRARQVESDTYVLRRLDAALARFMASAYTSPAPTDQAIAIAESEAFAKAIEWVGRLALHEMEGPLGRVALYASLEVASYADSKIKIELETLQQIFSGVTVLVEASRSPSRTDFDLAQLISDIVTIEVAGRSEVSMHGPRPFVVESDQALLRLAVGNGIKNAYEAIAEFGSSNIEHPIIVNWGRSDREYWVSVIDSGPGVKGSIEERLRAGNSTKEGHLGFGLAVAKQAMESLNGSLELHSARGSGASYDLRWSIF
ncbi:sensor histidine kinase [Xanthomonas hortorum]|uniref:sensor histidine kinase n=1 Tax=Xanthomonas hortorum TaxID=56454 RepID=UPI001592EEF0|nr:ATP-binding protein [Xanthomonas hortorum]NHF67736.1 sensor histidine kinase [Xanthomonas hortorum]